MTTVNSSWPALRGLPPRQVSTLPGHLMSNASFESPYSGPVSQAMCFCVSDEWQALLYCGSPYVPLSRYSLIPLFPYTPFSKAGDVLRGCPRSAQQSLSRPFLGKALQMATFVVVICLLALAIAEPLTTFLPCPAATRTLSPITITSQHQTVSTCTPTTACFRGACHTSLRFHSYPWVSTEIPCAFDGEALSTTMVTSVDEMVLCADETQTLTSISTIGTKQRGRGKYHHPPLSNTSIKLSLSRSMLRTSILDH